MPNRAFLLCTIIPLCVRSFGRTTYEPVDASSVVSMPSSRFGSLLLVHVPQGTMLLATRAIELPSYQSDFPTNQCHEAVSRANVSAAASEQAAAALRGDAEALRAELHQIRSQVQQCHHQEQQQQQQNEALEAQLLALESAHKVTIASAGAKHAECTEALVITREGLVACESARDACELAQQTAGLLPGRAAASRRGLP